MAGKSFSIDAVMKGVDKASGPVRKVSAMLSRNLVGGLRSVSRAAGRATLALGKTLAKVGLLAGGALAGLGALGVRAAHGFAMQADELGKFARQVGVSVEGLQELRFAAGQQGVGAAQFDKALKGMSKRVGELRAGTGSLYTFLEKAGLKTFAGQLKGAKSNEQAFELLMGALQRVEDPARKAALAAAAFGGRGVEMTRVAEAGAEGLAKLRKQARDLGVVTTGQATDAENYATARGEFTRAAGGLGAQLAGAVVPKLTKAAQATSAWIQANGGLIKQRLAQVFGVISRVLARIPWGAIIDGVKRAIEAIRPFATEVVETIRRNWDSISAYLKRVWDFIKLAAQTVVNVVHELWKGLASNLERVVDSIKEFFGGWKDFIAGVFTLDMGRAADGLLAVWRGFAGFWAGIWDSVKGAVGAAWTGIKEWFDKFVPKPIKDAWQGVVGWFGDLWSGISGVFKAGWAKVEPYLRPIFAAADKLSWLGKSLGIIDDSDEKLLEHARGQNRKAKTPEEAEQRRAARDRILRGERTDPSQRTTATPDQARSLARVAAEFQSQLRQPVGGRPIELKLNFAGLPAGVTVQAEPAPGAQAKVTTGKTGRRQVGAR